MKTNWLSVAVTVAAWTPRLSWRFFKRGQADAPNDRALAADATQSVTCAYLAAVTLAGLLTQVLWRVTWIDTAAAPAAFPVVILELRRTWRPGIGC